MKIFIDSGNFKDIESLVPLGIIDQANRKLRPLSAQKPKTL